MPSKPKRPSAPDQHRINYLRGEYGPLFKRSIHVNALDLIRANDRGDTNTAAKSRRAAKIQLMRMKSDLAEKQSLLDRANDALSADPVFSRVQHLFERQEIPKSEMPVYLEAINKFLNKKMTQKEYRQWAKKLQFRLDE